MSNTFFQGGEKFPGGFLPPCAPLVVVLPRIVNKRPSRQTKSPIQTAVL